MSRSFVAMLVAATVVLAGCAAPDPGDGLGEEGEGPGAPGTVAEIVSAGTEINLSGPCFQETGGPPAPPGEEVVGLQPIELIFGGSIRSADTRVLMTPPPFGDLGSPQNQSRSATAYLDATLQGIFAWEPTIDVFIEQYPEYAYLDEITVDVELLQDDEPAQTGADIVVAYVGSGPAFRGLAADGVVQPQPYLEQAGVADTVHYSDRYILLSLFAYSTRAGQSEPDFPETHEVRGVTMHEFAHVWGLGHSTTFTPGCGADLMNSPYPYIYGDGDPVGDGGERTRTLCITSLDMAGLAHLYRWLPNGTWEGSSGDLELPDHIVYEEYCDAMTAAAERSAAFLQAHGFDVTEYREPHEPF